MAGDAKLAVWCDEHGALISVLHDELDVTNPLDPGDPIRNICDPMSQEKVDLLFDELRNDAAVLDWRVNLPIADQVQQIHLTAARADNHVLMLATVEQDISGDLFEELIRINSDQANELRAVQKELAVRSRAAVKDRKPGSDTKQLEDFMQLHNELAALQREMARKNSELRRINDQKNHVLGVAAHDLRNPLGAISIFSKILLQQKTGDLNDKQLEIIERIAHSSSFMLSLVDDLLDYSKIESGRLNLHWEACDLGELVRESVAIHQFQAGAKNISITFDQGDNLPRAVECDPGKIEQVINNLVSNAIKYSEPGTKVVVTLYKLNNNIELEVRDEGQGIPKDELARLFIPFETTSVHGTAGEISTGLGLNIAHRIVSGHGGEIVVRSEVGVGTTFTVKLPLTH